MNTYIFTYYHNAEPTFITMEVWADNIDDAWEEVRLRLANVQMAHRLIMPDNFQLTSSY